MFFAFIIVFPWTTLEEVATSFDFVDWWGQQFMTIERNSHRFVTSLGKVTRVVSTDRQAAAPPQLCQLGPRRTGWETMEQNEATESQSRCQFALWHVQ